MKQWTTKTGVPLTCIQGGRQTTPKTQTLDRAWYSLPWIEQRRETTSTYDWSYLWIFGMVFESTVGEYDESEQDDAI